MPNHVTNKLTFEGSQEDIALLRDAIEGTNSDDEAISIDFNKIIPMPKTLSITSGSSVDNAIAIIKFQERNDDREIRKIMDYPWAKAADLDTPEKMCKHLLDNKCVDLDEGRIALSNLMEHGHQDWYSWSIANWGTKWNAYSVISEDEDEIEFQTAWSSPINVIESLSDQFPKVKITLKYADEDFGYNCGEIVFLEGIALETNQPEGGSIEAYKLAISIDDMEVGEFLDRFCESEDSDIISVMIEVYGASYSVEAIKEDGNDYMSVEFLNNLKNALIETEEYELIKEVDEVIERIECE